MWAGIAFAVLVPLAMLIQWAISPVYVYPQWPFMLLMAGFGAAGALFGWLLRLAGMAESRLRANST